MKPTDVERLGRTVGDLYRRLKAIEAFLDNHFNYNLWSTEIQKSPAPVKESGQIDMCACGRPGYFCGILECAINKPRT